MQIAKPFWSSATYLVYLGGLTVLGAALSALSYLSMHYGDAAYAGWALLVYVVLEAIAGALLPRHRITSGVFAFAAVFGFAGLALALWKWFGWIDGRSGTGSPFAGFHVSRLSLVLVVLLVAIAAVQVFRFPLLVILVVGLSWYLVTDLISNGGNWSAWVTLVFGLVLLLVAVAIDGGERRPYGFWVHVGAGLLFGGALLYFWHSGNWRWALIAVSAVVFMRLAPPTGRSSWAVIGSIGWLAAATHFTIEWWHHGVPIFGGGGGTTRGWVPPLVFAIAGFSLVAFGFALSRRER